MDTTSKIAIASCVMSLVVSLPSFADVTTNHFPTIAEIDAEIASLANKQSEGPGPGADFIFTAISLCFVKISAARSRQPFIPASSAPPETRQATKDTQ